jgi:DNA-binding transcriptional LysR family regulator
MEIRQIKYFIQICTDKSLSKAAENLHISQQGLSKTIKNLEDELGTPLFDRSSKGVRPTEFGILLLEKSQKIVSEFDLMVDFLHEKAKLKKGTISIGLPRSLYTCMFATIICEFQDTYPEIKLKIVEAGSNVCEKNVEDNLLDISIAFNSTSTEKFQFIPISSFDMMLLVNKANSLSQKNTVKFRDLKKEKFIMFSPEHKSHQLTSERCLLSGFKPNIVFTTSQLELIVEMVVLNKGIAILPESNSLKAVKCSDKVSAVSFQDKSFNVEAGFIYNKCHNLNNITTTLINYTLNFFKDNMHQ